MKLPLKECAEIYRIPRSTLTMYVQKGLINADKTNREFLLCPKEVEDYLNSRKSMKNNGKVVKIYDVITRSEINWIVGKTGNTKQHNLQGLVAKKIEIAEDRYVLPENKHRIFTLVDFETENEYECLTYKTIYLHLNIPVNKRESYRILELKNKNIRYSYVANRILHLKGAKKPRIIKEKYLQISQKYQKIYNERLSHRKLATLGRSRIKSILKLKGINKRNTSFELLGCSANFLKQHLESQFALGMNWENYGNKKNQWSIDHIIPCTAFDLHDLEQQKQCFHYSNLQPLWWEDNMAKLDKLNWIKPSKYFL